MFTLNTCPWEETQLSLRLLERERRRIPELTPPLCLPTGRVFGERNCSWLCLIVCADVWIWGNCHSSNCRCCSRSDEVEVLRALVLESSVVGDVRSVFLELPKSLISNVYSFCYWHSLYLSTPCFPFCLFTLINPFLMLKSRSNSEVCISSVIWLEFSFWIILKFEGFLWQIIVSFIWRLGF